MKIDRNKEVDERLLKLIFENLPSKKSIKRKIYQKNKDDLQKEIAEIDKILLAEDNK